MNILAVPIKRRTMYVSFEEDTIPNKGGYFCQIWYDPNKEVEYENPFTIQSRDLRGASDKEKLARSLAIAKVKSIFGVF